jgi:hypothetical protein
MPDQTCTGCRQIITDDPSGLCEDCQTDVVSQRPGSVTGEQRLAIIGLMESLGILLPRSRRNEVIAEVVPGWQWAGDLGVLSQEQAARLLENLHERHSGKMTRR